MNQNKDENEEYLKAVVQKKPRQDDPKEIAITNKIRQQVSQTEWARQTIDKIKSLQINYMKEVITKIGNPPWIHTHTQNFLKEISSLLRAEVVEGSEFLKEIPKESPVLLMTNHLGIYKLAGINPKKELSVDIPGYDFMYPSPMYFAGLSPVAEKIGDNLSYVSDDFPGVFGKIHRASGFIHVPPPNPQNTNRTEALLEQTRNALKPKPNIAIVNYPEGGTSGKYSGLGPYDLEPFKTGGYVIASKLGVRVLPVAQYFDPEKGLQLKVFNSYIPETTDREGYEKYAHKDRVRMQEWFDRRKNS